MTDTRRKLSLRAEHIFAAALQIFQDGLLDQDEAGNLIRVKVSAHEAACTADDLMREVEKLS